MFGSLWSEFENLFLCCSQLKAAILPFVTENRIFANILE